MSTYIYIQNRIDDENIMTNGVSYSATDREVEMYRKCRGDNENMGGESY